MKTITKKTPRRKAIKEGRRKTRFPGICADAAALGCHRMHLYQVLAGKRTSHSLLKSYRALKASQEVGK